MLFIQVLKERRS